MYSQSQHTNSGPGLWENSVLHLSWNNCQATLNCSRFPQWCLGAEGPFPLWGIVQKPTPIPILLPLLPTPTALGLARNHEAE